MIEIIHVVVTALTDADTGEQLDPHGAVYAFQARRDAEQYLGQVDPGVTATIVSVPVVRGGFTL